MIGRAALIAATKRFLRRRGLLVDRYTCGTSPDLRLVRMLESNGIDLVLDVGANDGGYAAGLRAAGYHDRVLSFEPLSTAYSRLVAATARDTAWVAAPRMALGDHDGHATINIAGNSASSSIMAMTDHHRAAAPESAYVGSEMIEVRKLDSVRHPFLDAATAPFLKIDTQGYENEVLAGAAMLMPRLKGVQVELSLHLLYDGQCLWREMIAKLESAGFDLWALVPGFFDPRSGRMLQCDGVFFRPGG
jgi:FkbM family methyltransferase